MPLDRFVLNSVFQIVYAHRTKWSSFEQDVGYNATKAFPKMKKGEIPVPLMIWKEVHNDAGIFRTMPHTLFGTLARV